MKTRKWWPHIALTLIGIMIGVIVFVAFMADIYPVPDDAPLEIPMPDEGADIPGPEWIFLLFWIPFWYFKGSMKKYLFLTALVPIFLIIIFALLPYFHKIPLHRIPLLGAFLRKTREMESGFIKSFIYAIPALILAVALTTGVYRSGHQAKVYGCDSCHNPAMGYRMAIPPTDVAKYYNVERAMQIGVGKYRAGKSAGQDSAGEMVSTAEADDVGGYKDANWQMRHMYEPTFTW